MNTINKFNYMIDVEIDSNVDDDSVAEPIDEVNENEATDTKSIPSHRNLKDSEMHSPTAQTDSCVISLTTNNPEPEDKNLTIKDEIEVANENNDDSHTQEDKICDKTQDEHKKIDENVLPAVSDQSQLQIVNIQPHIKIIQDKTEEANRIATTNPQLDDLKVIQDKTEETNRIATTITQLDDLKVIQNETEEANSIATTNPPPDNLKVNQDETEEANRIATTNPQSDNSKHSIMNSPTTQIVQNKSEKEEDIEYDNELEFKDYILPQNQTLNEDCDSVAFSTNTPVYTNDTSSKKCEVNPKNLYENISNQDKSVISSSTLVHIAASDVMVNNDKTGEAKRKHDYAHTQEDKICDETEDEQRNIDEDIHPILDQIVNTQLDTRSHKDKVGLKHGAAVPMIKMHESQSECSKTKPASPLGSLKAICESIGPDLGKMERIQHSPVEHSGLSSINKFTNDTFDEAVAASEESDVSEDEEALMIVTEDNHSLMQEYKSDRCEILSDPPSIPEVHVLKNKEETTSLPCNTSSITSTQPALNIDRSDRCEILSDSPEDRVLKNKEVSTTLPCNVPAIPPTQPALNIDRSVLREEMLRLLPELLDSLKSEPSALSKQTKTTAAAAPQKKTTQNNELKSHTVDMNIAQEKPPNHVREIVIEKQTAQNDELKSISVDTNQAQPKPVKVTNFDLKIDKNGIKQKIINRSVQHCNDQTHSLYLENEVLPGSSHLSQNSSYCFSKLSDYPKQPISIKPNTFNMSNQVVPTINKIFHLPQVTYVKQSMNLNKNSLTDTTANQCFPQAIYIKPVELNNSSQKKVNPTPQNLNIQQTNYMKPPWLKENIEKKVTSTPQNNLNVQQQTNYINAHGKIHFDSNGKVSNPAQNLILPQAIYFEPLKLNTSNPTTILSQSAIPNLRTNVHVVKPPDPPYPVQRSMFFFKQPTTAHSDKHSGPARTLSQSTTSKQQTPVHTENCQGRPRKAQSTVYINKRPARTLSQLINSKQQTPVHTGNRQGRPRKAQSTVYINKRRTPVHREKLLDSVKCLESITQNESELRRNMIVQNCEVTVDKIIEQQKVNDEVYYKVKWNSYSWEKEKEIIKSELKDALNIYLAGQSDSSHLEQPTEVQDLSEMVKLNSSLGDEYPNSNSLSVQSDSLHLEQPTEVQELSEMIKLNSLLGEKCSNSNSLSVHNQSLESSHDTVDSVTSIKENVSLFKLVDHEGNKHEIFEDTALCVVKLNKNDSQSIVPNMSSDKMTYNSKEADCQYNESVDQDKTQDNTLNISPETEPVLKKKRRETSVIIKEDLVKISPILSVDEPEREQGVGYKEFDFAGLLAKVKERQSQNVGKIEKKKKCEHCKSKFTSNDLSKHNRIYAKLLCPQCGLRVCDKKKLSKHIRAHAQTLHQCPLCCKVFKDPNLYIAHKHNDHHGKIISKNIEQNTWKCTQCTKGFKKKIVWMKHIAKHFNVENIKENGNTCRVCQKGFLTPQKLEAHTSLHQVSYKECEQCEECFDVEEDASEHSCTGVPSIKYISNFQEVSLEISNTNPSKLSKHYQRIKKNTFSKRKKKNISCISCIKGFKTRNSFYEHIVKECPNLKDNGQCMLCKQFFKSSDNLKAHVTSCFRDSLSSSVGQFRLKSRGDDDSSHITEQMKRIVYHCRKCNTLFPSLHVLRNHNNILHPRSEKYQCVKCGFSCLGKALLKKHLRNNQCPKLLFYKCFLCEQNRIHYAPFSSILMLIAHLKSHRKPTIQKKIYIPQIKQFTQTKKSKSIPPAKISTDTGKSMLLSLPLEEARALCGKPALCDVPGFGSYLVKLDGTAPNEFFTAEKFEKSEIESDKGSQQHPNSIRGQKKLLPKQVAKMPVQIKSPSFLCFDCFQPCQSRLHVMNHFREGHQWRSIQLFICSSCNIAFRDKRSFNTHLEKCISSCPQASVARNDAEMKDLRFVPFLFACSSCDTPFYNREDFEEHAKQQTLWNNEHYCNLKMVLINWPCYICNKKIKPTELLSDHVKGHEKIIYECYCCSVKTSNEDKLVHHLLTNHDRKWGADDDVWLKSISQFEKILYNIYKNVKRNPSSTVTIESAKIQCPNCKVLFFHEETLSRHETACSKKSEDTNLKKPLHLQTSIPTDSSNDTNNHRNESKDTAPVQMSVRPKNNRKDRSNNTLGKAIIKKSAKSMLDNSIKLKLPSKQIVNLLDVPNTVYICLYCNNCVFKDKEKLKEHILSEHGARYFETLPLRKELYKIKISSEQLVRYSCHLCDKWFLDRESTWVHAFEHVNRRVEKCHICPRPRSFVSTTALRFHLNSVHNALFCLLCYKTFHKLPDLNTHLQLHVLEVNIPRDENQKMVIEIETNPNWMDSEQYLLPGDQSGAKFTITSKVSRDILEDSRLFHCHVCKKNIEGELTFVIHVKTHCEPRRLSCLLCRKTFIEKENLQKHMVKHYTKLEFNFLVEEELEKEVYQVEEAAKCNVCFEVFETTADLHSHKKQNKFVFNSIKKSHNNTDIVKMYCDQITGRKQSWSTDWQVAECFDLKRLLCILRYADYCLRQYHPPLAKLRIRDFEVCLYCCITLEKSHTRTHLKLHEVLDRSEMSRCPYCPWMGTWSNLAAHMSSTTHTATSLARTQVRRFHCPYCFVGGNSIADDHFEKHQRDLPIFTDQLYCVYCHKIVKKKDMEKHMLNQPTLGAASKNTISYIDIKNWVDREAGYTSIRESKIYFNVENEAHGKVGMSSLPKDDKSLSNTKPIESISTSIKKSKKIFNFKNKANFISTIKHIESESTSNIESITHPYLAKDDKSLPPIKHIEFESTSNIESITHPYVTKDDKSLPPIKHIEAMIESVTDSIVIDKPVSSVTNDDMLFSTVEEHIEVSDQPDSNNDTAEKKDDHHSTTKKTMGKKIGIYQEYNEELEPFDFTVTPSSVIKTALSLNRSKKLDKIVNENMEEPTKKTPVKTKRNDVTHNDKTPTKNNTESSSNTRKPVGEATRKTETPAKHRIMFQFPMKTETKPIKHNEKVTVKTDKELAIDSITDMKSNDEQKEHGNSVANALMDGLENPDCKICHWKFKTFTQLKEHLIKHVSHPYVRIDHDSRDACCIFCQTIVRRTSMTTHMNLKHTKEMNKGCKKMSTETVQTSVCSLGHRQFNLSTNSKSVMSDLKQTPAVKQGVERHVGKQHEAGLSTQTETEVKFSTNSESKPLDLKLTPAVEQGEESSSIQSEKTSCIMPYPFNCSVCFRGYFTTGTLLSHVKSCHPWLYKGERRRLEEEKKRKRNLKVDEQIINYKIIKVDKVKESVQSAIPSNTIICEQELNIIHDQKVKEEEKKKVDDHQSKVTPSTTTTITTKDIPTQLSEETPQRNTKKATETIYSGTELIDKNQPLMGKKIITVKDLNSGPEVEQKHGIVKMCNERRMIRPGKPPIASEETPVKLDTISKVVAEDGKHDSPMKENINQFEDQGLPDVDKTKNTKEANISHKIKDTNATFVGKKVNEKHGKDVSDHEYPIVSKLEDVDTGESENESTVTEVEEETEEEIIESESDGEAVQNGCNQLRSPKHKTNSSSKYPCPHCNLSFPCHTELVTHVTVHVNLNQKERHFNVPYPYICLYCGTGFYKTYDLKKHLKGKHSILYQPDLEKNNIFINHALGLEQDYEKNNKPDEQDKLSKQELPKRDRSKFKDMLLSIKTGRMGEEIADDGSGTRRTSGRKRSVNKDVLEFLQKEKIKRRKKNTDVSENPKKVNSKKRKIDNIDSTEDVEAMSSSEEEKEDEDKECSEEELKSENGDEETESNTDEEDSSSESSDNTNESSSSDSDSDSDENMIKKKSIELVCQYCDLILLNSKSLKEHIKAHSKTLLPYSSDTFKLICTHCQIPIVRHELKWHMHIGHGHIQKLKLYNEKKYCVKCNFSTKKDLDEHITTEHPEMLKVECRLCDLRFSTQAIYKKHFTDTHGKTIDEDSLECFLCNKKFQSISRLHYHYSIIHMKKDENLYCSLCCKFFYGQTSLEKHEEEYHNNDQFQCGLCLIEFDNVDKCEKHVQIHKDATEFQCTTCCFYFKSSETLDEHKTTHRSQSFTCSECNEVFSILANYQKHKLTHSTELPVPKLTCNICNKALKDGEELKEHEKAHSSIQRNYHCSSCNKTFNAFNDIRTHMDNVHQGGARAMGNMTVENDSGDATPSMNECQICGETFLRTEIYLRHMEKHK